jgi:hypothetical protein
MNPTTLLYCETSENQWCGMRPISSYAKVKPIRTPLAARQWRNLAFDTHCGFEDHFEKSKSCRSIAPNALLRSKKARPSVPIAEPHSQRLLLPRMSPHSPWAAISRGSADG